MRAGGCEAIATEAVAEIKQRPVPMVREKRLSSREEVATADNGRLGQGAMLMRSTGLGKAELVAEILSLRRQGDYLIMELQTTQPVRWKIRSGISHADLRMLVRAMLKRSVLSFLFDVRAWFKRPAHPGDF
jgi:hypothetical protein